MRLSLLVVLPLAILPALGSGCSKPAASSDSEAKTYSTKGTIKTFGPDKKYASIAHENIPGYMSAMTMSFEPQTPSMLDGLNAGDKVEFTFKADGSKHIITAIKKAP
ncbi:MAG: copper-binding protein [Polyangiaceae bacterium]|jgi:Cu/Ag efflux protein CusF|nr:copper-binding protein [Polyangiaceae bacterium]